MKRWGVLVVSLLTGVVAVTLLFSANRGARSIDPVPTPTRTPAASPTPTAGSRDPPNVRNFIADVNAVCARLGRPHPIPDGEDPGVLAATMKDELVILEPLLSRLRDVRVPAALRRQMRFYRRRLSAQIRLDRLVQAAAVAKDAQSVELGMTQNDYNRDRRTELARAIGFSTCLTDPGRGT